MKTPAAVYLVSLCFAPSLWLWLDVDKRDIAFHNSSRYWFIFPQQTRLDSLRTEKQYLAALRTADATTFRKEFELEFLLLLDKKQRQEYDSLATLEARKAYIENYWQASNPNPLLPENDWLLDVLKRRAYARENFPAPAPPYFDDRGKYYLKYGKPRFRHQDAGGYKRVNFFNNENVYDFIKKFYPFGLAPDRVYTAIANECWAYENVARDFVVYFVREGMAFRETKNLKALSETRQRRNLSWQLSDAIKQRAAVSPALGRVWTKIGELEMEILEKAAFRSRTPPLASAPVENFDEKLLKFVRDLEYDLNHAGETAPVAAHDEINAVNKLQFSETLAQFRAPNGNTRIEIALLSLLEKNLVKNISPAADTMRLAFNCLISNAQFETIAQDEALTQLVIKIAAQEKLLQAVGRLTVAISPQDGDLTLQIKDERSSKLGFSRQPLKIRDFRGQDLMISDIQFLTEIVNANQRQILPVFTRLNTAVAPYPFEKIRQTIPLLCYFEIYNLKTSGVTEQYEIVYKIVSAKGGNKDAAVSVSSTRAVSDDTAPELIGIDLRKVPKGEHRLEITVTAMNDRKITASIQKEIRIDD